MAGGWVAKWLLKGLEDFETSKDNCCITMELYDLDLSGNGLVHRMLTCKQEGLSSIPRWAILITIPRWREKAQLKVILRVPKQPGAQETVSLSF